MWSDIWNVSYIELRIWNQLSHDHRSYERNLSNCVERPEKVRISTGFVNSRVQTPLKSWLFQASLRNCLNCVYNCDDHGLLALNFARRAVWSMLPNAFHKSRSTTSATFLAYRASSALVVIMTLTVSQEWSFLLPLWCWLRRFLLYIYVINWLRATRSQIFDAAGRNETGRLLFGIWWSPSFGSGMTSDIFDLAGKTDDNNDRFTMSVSTGKCKEGQS